tara:strand:+ start:13 stop:651 length:639 start_codon:yes stop_codon:yes gene_type:complete
MTFTDSTYLDAKKVKERTGGSRIEIELLRDFLKEEFSATLLNADVYFQPVVTTLDPSLRLIIDSEIKSTNLPIYYLDRNVIRDKFLSICKESNSELTKDIIDNKLSVEYVEFDELFFEETRCKVNHNSILESINEPGILKMINYFSEYIFFYQNKDEMENQLKKNLQNVIKNKITELIIKEGYNGNHLSDIAIRFDIIDSLEKAGSEYNYLR